MPTDKPLPVEGSNHPRHDQALSHARLAGNNWRTGRANAYAMAHGLILAVVTEDFARKPLFEAAKKEMRYSRMDKADQANVRKLGQHIGEVIDAWPTLPAEMRERFIQSGDRKGGYVYSTLLGDIRKRDAAAEASEAEAAFAEELAELGITAEEYAARQEQAENEKAFIAACDAIVTTVTADGFVPSETQQAALARIAALLAPAEPAKANAKG